jgi:hypothetical protein
LDRVAWGILAVAQAAPGDGWGLVFATGLTGATPKYVDEL